MIKVGLLAAKTASLDPETVSRLSPKGVSIVPLIYSDPEEIIPLYERNHWFLDGILFGGIYSQTIITQYTQPRIPYTYLKIGDSDFLGVLLNLALEGITDFTRVATDLYSSCQPFAQSLGYQNVPIAISPLKIEKDAFDYSRETFLRLIAEGKVDIIISRFSAFAEEMQALGCRFIYIPNSDQSCAKELLTLVTTIRDRQVNNNLPTVGLICNKSMMGSDLEHMSVFARQLLMALNHFNLQHGMCLMIHPIGLDCEVLTSNADLFQITEGYYTCRLGEYLREHLDFPVSIGWGVGMTMDEAYHAAASALVSSIGEHTVSMFQNGTGNRPIPLDSHRKFREQNDLPILKDIEGISPRNLNKLYELITTKGLYQLSSEDISYYLDITKRSATRIATVLVENQLAEISHKQQTKVKGRPAIIYQIYPEHFFPKD